MSSPHSVDPRAPMASAPMRYTDDGSVDWGNMWDTFCALAQSGGPAHRATLLNAPAKADPSTAAYQQVAQEIVRGIYEVSELRAFPDAPGWVAVECSSAGMAYWLKNAILQENVAARQRENLLLVPCGENFTVHGEIKNVITVVAKTTHYWDAHLSPEWQKAQDTEADLDKWQARIRGLLKR